MFGQSYADVFSKFVERKEFNFIFFLCSAQEGTVCSDATTTKTEEKELQVEGG